MAAVATPVGEQPQDLLKQQQELQAKILSVLNKPTPAPPSSTPATPVVSAVSYSTFNHSPAPQPVTSMAGINLDNPNIQKAIDNLISSGPKLLQNLTSVSQAGTTQSSLYSGQGLRHAAPNSSPSLQQQDMWRPSGQWGQHQPQAGQGQRAPAPLMQTAGATAGQGLPSMAGMQRTSGVAGMQHVPGMAPVQRNPGFGLLGENPNHYGY